MYFLNFFSAFRKNSFPWQIWYSYDLASTAHFMLDIEISRSEAWNHIPILCFPIHCNLFQNLLYHHVPQNCFSPAFSIIFKAFLSPHACMLNHVQLFATLWTVAYKAPLPVEFSRQEWVAISFSRGSSRPRVWTHVSCISCNGRWILNHCYMGTALPPHCCCCC